MTLHQQIDEALASNQHGWCSRGKAADLASIIVSMGGGNAVEVGVYTGRSLIPMALAMKHVGKGVAIGIDPFEADASTADENEQHADWWKRVPFEKIEHILMESIAENECGEFAQVIKKRSDDVEPPKDLILAHVDGNHADTAIRDVARFCANVVIGGFAVLDDVGWDSGCVSASIQILRDLGFVERRRVVGKEEGTIYTNDYAIFQRTSKPIAQQPRMIPGDVNPNAAYLYQNR